MSYRQLYLNLFGEGGGEHERLAIARLGHRVLLDDATDLWLEPHVQHAVSLVQD